MIKVTVLYPNEEGKRFDIDYYCNKHIPLAQEKMGAACKGIAVDQGLAGGEPGAPAPYVVIAHMLFDSLEAFQAAFAASAEEIGADLPNYTDIEPIIQISEVKL